MGIKIILMICIYPVLFILHFALKYQADSSARARRIYFGVKLTAEQAAAPEVRKVSDDYNRLLGILLAVFAVLPLPALFIPWFSVYFTFQMLWMFAVIAGYLLAFVSANGKLKQIKREKGWRREEERYLAVELKSAGMIRKVNFRQFALPILVSAAAPAGSFAGLFGERLRDMSVAIGSFACCTVLFYAAAVWMDRLPVRVISTESEINVNYARAQKQLWKNFWQRGAWLNALYTVCMIPAFGRAGGLWGIFLPASVLYLAAQLILLVRLLKKKKDLDVLYAGHMDMEPGDDDDKWAGGMFYYNPRDRHTFVQSRDGSGSTCNLARPGGKILMVFCGMCVLLALFSCVWVMLTEFTPIRLEVREERLIASQLKQDYAIPLVSVQEPALLKELPSFSKVSGTGMDTLLRGTFRVPEEGRCQLFLNPQNTVFIRFEYGGTTYYMSGGNDEETLEAWNALGFSQN